MRLLADRYCLFTSYTDNNESGEGCEGNEGSTEDRWLTILFSIRELVSGLTIYLLFSIEFKPKLAIYYCLQHYNIVDVEKRYSLYAFTAFTTFTFCNLFGYKFIIYLHSVWNCRCFFHPMSYTYVILCILATFHFERQFISMSRISKL
jgi:hypothetical protein